MPARVFLGTETRNESLLLLACPCVILWSMSRRVGSVTVVMMTITVSSQTSFLICLKDPLCSSLMAWFLSTCMKYADISSFVVWRMLHTFLKSIILQCSASSSPVRVESVEHSCGTPTKAASVARLLLLRHAVMSCGPFSSCTVKWVWSSVVRKSVSGCDSDLVFAYCTGNVYGTPVCSPDLLSAEIRRRTIVLL